MKMGELLEALQIVVSTYEDSVFLSFTLLIAFAVCLGIKRIMVDL